MDVNQTLIAITSISFIVLIVIFSSAFSVASKSIFTGSGGPPAMGKILIRALGTSSEITFGLFGVIIIAILIANGLITSESGLPIIASTLSFILGKGFKNLSFGEEK